MLTNVNNLARFDALPVRRIGMIRLGWKIFRYFGVGWIAYRMKLAIQSRLGTLESRLPKVALQDHPLEKWLADGVPHEPSAYCAWHDENAPRLFSLDRDMHLVSATV